MLGSPFIPPRLTLRVGVTGHRPDRLGIANQDLLRQRISEVLTCLAEVTRQLQLENDTSGSNPPFESGVAPYLRFTTAIAAGTDSFAAEVAIEAGYDLNIFLPFPRNIYVRDFDQAERKVFDRLWSHSPETTTRTELDLGSEAGNPAGYHAAGQAVLAHSDILLAVWDGKPAAGRGGTAEVITGALENGVPTILVSTDGAIQIDAGNRQHHDPSKSSTWKTLQIDNRQAACSNALADRARSLLALPEPVHYVARGEGHGDAAPSPKTCLNRFRGEEVRHSSYACVYNALLALFGVRDKFRLRVDYDDAETLAIGRWDRVLDCAQEVGGEDFANRIVNRLQDRWRRADNLANHYANLFRSAYVSNFTLAALAVLVGLLVIPAANYFDGTTLLAVKSVLVLLELAFIGTILWTTLRGNRQVWHQRWLDYRSLAEALRPARLPFLMGSSPLRPGEVAGTTPGQEWVAWYVRASLREIAPPTALIGTKTLREVIDASLDSEIDAQISYHRSNAARLQKLDHRMESAARFFLWGTIAAGLLYLLAFAYFLVTYDKFIVKDIAKPWATFLGGTLPVIGAALFGIRATGDFRTAAKQSTRMVGKLEWLREELFAQRDAPDRLALRRVLDRTIFTMTDDLGVWGLIYSERALEAGF